EAESTLRGDDLSEDIVRLKDIREGLGNILDGTREQVQSRGAAVKPPATSLSSPISKSRLHPRQSFNHPPPATPASSARKRQDALGTITALESAFGKQGDDENTSANAELVSSEYIVTRRRFS
ncbi:hypothetical protein FOZ62_016813, partial [Perkinsus olseni]